MHSSRLFVVSVLAVLLAWSIAGNTSTLLQIGQTTGASLSPEQTSGGGNIEAHNVAIYYLCFECRSDYDCPVGYFCNNGQCLDRCAVIFCPEGTTCVNGECVPIRRGLPGTLGLMLLILICGITTAIAVVIAVKATSKQSWKEWFNQPVGGAKKPEPSQPTTPSSRRRKAPSRGTQNKARRSKSKRTTAR